MKCLPTGTQPKSGRTRIRGHFLMIRRPVLLTAVLSFLLRGRELQALPLSSYISRARLPTVYSSVKWGNNSMPSYNIVRMGLYTVYNVQGFMVLGFEDLGFATVI